jgi:hypothetical protein
MTCGCNQGKNDKNVKAVFFLRNFSSFFLTQDLIYDDVIGFEIVDS